MGKVTPKRSTTKKASESSSIDNDSKTSLPFKNPKYQSQQKKLKTMKQILDNSSSITDPGKSVQVPPSLKPRRKYCDVTGLLAKYEDPKTRMRYHSSAVFQFIKSLSPDAVQQFLKIRNAHTIVK